MVKHDPLYHFVAAALIALWTVKVVHDGINHWKQLSFSNRTILCCHDKNFEVVSSPYHVSHCRKLWYVCIYENIYLRSPITDATPY